MPSKPPSPHELIFGDLERELAVTRTVLERLPEDKFAWKPHEKSMHLGRLAMHVATLPEWARVTLADNGLDMATAPRPRVEPKDKKDLLAEFDKSAADLREIVKKFDPAKIGDTWTFGSGSQIMASKPKAVVYRIWCINHMIHHRAQLCLYLRLLNVPVPAVYFNSADEPDWKFD
jgi:uncharacterized damage-inducible protein DinB